MASIRRERARTAAAEVPGREGAEALLVPLGLLAAAVLPFFVVSTVSDEAHLEAKLFAQAAGGALALAGLFLSREAEPRAASPRLLRAAALAAAGAVALAVVSALVHHASVDPLVFVSFLSPAALFLAATALRGRGTGGRLLAFVAAAGAVTGALAFGQRFLGLWRLPVETPQERFLATALIGNPGEMAAALVVPALLLWSGALDAGRPRRARLLSAAGFFACALGLGAAETMTTIAAVLAGLLAHAVLAPRRRLLPLLAALALGAAVLSATGAGARLVRKVGQLRSGRIGDALTQRDIGLAAGARMVRSAPLLGFGPAGYSQVFAEARLAAEGGARRRFVHRSESAHFENAHFEPLTLAAENGVPASLLALASFALLLGAVFRRGGEERSRTRDLLVPGLLAFLVLALGSFPLRMPVSAGTFALLAGVAWRRAGGGALLPERPRRRRPLVAALAALVLVAGGVRLLAALWQGRGAALLRQAATSPDRRADLLAESRAALSRSLALRPRAAATWMALGSCDRLGGDTERAWERTARSFALEERAETDLALGLIAWEQRDPDRAHQLFVRAVWLLPRLLGALEDEHAPGAVELDVSDAEGILVSGGGGPTLPPAVEALRLNRLR